MKLKIHILLILSLFAACVYGQQIGDLNGINYQAVALAAGDKEIVGMDIEAKPLFEKQIDVRFTIQKGPETNATIEYQETHTTTTDQDGLFSLVIGQGITTPSTQYNRLLDIPWIDADQFLKVEIAVEGGEFRVVSIEKFQSVPYSFYTDDIADDAITTAKILNEEILAEDIGTGSVQTSEILNETILAEDVATGAITTDEILDATVLNEDIADGTINISTKVQDTLAVMNGGTGLGAVQQGDILVGDGTNALKSLAVTDSAMLFSNAGGNTDLYVLRPGPRTSISVDESTKTITITALEQGGGPGTGVGDVSVGVLNPGDQAERNFPASGVSPGDIILATIDQDLQGITMTAYVRQEGQVNVIFFNGTGKTISLGPVTVNFANFGQP